MVNYLIGIRFSFLPTRNDILLLRQIPALQIHFVNECLVMEPGMG
jgi:hypothetical protein